MRHILFSISLCVALAACTGPTNDDDSVHDCDLLGGDKQPEVFIDEPSNALVVDEEDPINWIVLLEDEDSEVSEIQLQALDVSDGTAQEIDFEVPGPDGAGRAEFTLSGDTLGTGVVVVRIEATDSVGCRGDDQVVVCIDVPASDCDFN